MYSLFFYKHTQAGQCAYWNVESASSLSLRKDIKDNMTALHMCWDS